MAALVELQQSSGNDGPSAEDGDATAPGQEMTPATSAVRGSLDWSVIAQNQSIVFPTVPTSIKAGRSPPGDVNFWVE